MDQRNRHAFASSPDTQKMWVANQLKSLRKNREVFVYNIDTNDQKKELDERIKAEGLVVEIGIVYRAELTRKDEVDYWIYTGYNFGN